MLQLIFLILVVVFVVYGLINENTYHKPKIFIFMGLGVCLISVLFIDLAFLLSSENIKIFDVRTNELFKNFVTISLAALGGGLMSTGFILSAQKKHNEKNVVLQDKIKDLEQTIAELQNKIDACDLINKDEQKSKYVIKQADLDEKLEDLRKELIKRTYL